MSPARRDDRPEAEAITREPPGRRSLLVGAAALALVLLAWAAHMRPAARAGRVLEAAGLGELPASAADLFVQRQGRSLAGGVTFVRFSASGEDIARLVERSGVTDPNEAAALGAIRFGSRSPFVEAWDSTVQGCMYHWEEHGASVWLAVDDGTETVYIALYDARRTWLDRLLR